MKNNTKKGAGILALLGIAGGAFAYWKYRNMSPEQKTRLKDKMNEAGDKVKDTYSEIEESITDKYEQLKKITQEQKEKMAS